MLEVFLYTLMCYGLSSALVYYSGPFNVISNFRDYFASNGNKYLDELFSCMFCLPVNIGIVLSIISLCFASSCPFTPFTTLFQGHETFWPLIIVFDGFYTGGTVSIIDSIMDAITKNRVETDKQLLTD